MMVNMFDSMCNKLSNEMVILLKHAKKVLFAPTRGHGAARVTESAQIWQNLENEIKGQVRSLADTDSGDNSDQIFIIGKMMNMKDKLMQQILAALLYKKTVIWKDLKINPGASHDTNEIYAS